MTSFCTRPCSFHARIRSYCFEYEVTIITSLQSLKWKFIPLLNVPTRKNRICLYFQVLSKATCTNLVNSESQALFRPFSPFLTPVSLLYMHTHLKQSSKGRHSIDIIHLHKRLTIFLRLDLDPTNTIMAAAVIESSYM